MPNQIALLSVLCAVLLSPASYSAQCEGSVLDTLEEVVALDVNQGTGVERVVTVRRVTTTRAPRIDIFERTSPGAALTLAESLAPAAWEPAWYIWHIAADGDLIAHQFAKPYATTPDWELSISQRTVNGWSTSSVELPRQGGLRYGQLTEILGDRVATLTARNVGRPIELHLIERDALDVWELTQTVVIDDLRAPYPDYPTHLALGQDVAAVALTLHRAGVAVCERSPDGTWMQTALLPSPGTVNSIAIHGQEIAVLRFASTLQGPMTLHVYERAASGQWRVRDRLSVPLPALAGWPATQWSLAFDGNRLAVSNLEHTTLFARPASGQFAPMHQVNGLGLVAGFSGDELVGKAAEVVAVDAPTVSGVTDVCALVGQTTCPGTGSATLRIHDRFGYGLRRAVAEVIDATPGLTAILFRSEERGASVALGGELCIDRRSALRVGTPTTIDAAGTAVFPLTVDGPQPGFGGMSAADHLQAVILGASPALTNALAWLP